MKKKIDWHFRLISVCSNDHTTGQLENGKQLLIFAVTSQTVPFIRIFHQFKSLESFESNKNNEKKHKNMHVEIAWVEWRVLDLGATECRLNFA